MKNKKTWEKVQFFSHFHEDGTECWETTGENTRAMPAKRAEYLYRKVLRDSRGGVVPAYEDGAKFVPGRRYSLYISWQGGLPYHLYVCRDTPAPMHKPTITRQPR